MLTIHVLSFFKLYLVTKVIRRRQMCLAVLIDPYSARAPLAIELQKGDSAAQRRAGQAYALSDLFFCSILHMTILQRLWTFEMQTQISGSLFFSQLLDNPLVIVRRLTLSI